MKILLQRIYDELQETGYRVLVDRIWPRGITKQHASLDEWCKELAPSASLRKWFSHKAERWVEFSNRYRKELEHSKHIAEELRHRAGKKKIVLLYGAKDSQHTHAIVLKDFLESR